MRGLDRTLNCRAVPLPLRRGGAARARQNDLIQPPAGVLGPLVARHGSNCAVADGPDQPERQEALPGIACGDSR